MEMVGMALTGVISRSADAANRQSHSASFLAAFSPFHPDKQARIVGGKAERNGFP